MGAWGYKAFQNDSAMNWFGELTRRGVAALRAALAEVADADKDEYLDVDEGSAAVAAAEIVAAATGGGRDRLIKKASAWLDANGSVITGDDRTLARRAVARVNATNSELRSLWNGDESEWNVDVRELERRLA